MHFFLKKKNEFNNYIKHISIKSCVDILVLLMA
jgi:hypothetical protein